MARQRTKVAEWWETDFDRSNPLREVPKRTKQGARAVARISGGKVHHVTRYRLAPLVRLRWKHDDEYRDTIERIDVVRTEVRATWRR